MKKHFQYLWYVLRHKWFVLMQCWSYGLLWRGLTHDLSKFRPDEWLPYCENFYGPRPPTDEVKAAFNMAWLHHQHRNPHHWQYYLLRGSDGTYKAFPMSERDTLEMVADWVGAGRAITGKVDVWGWYEKNKKGMHLHAETRLKVEQLLLDLKRDLT